MRFLVLGCFVAACGRLGFEEPRLAPGDAMADRPADAASDVMTRVVPCPPAAAVPTTVTVAGETFEYTGFNNQTGPVPSTVVSIFNPGGLVDVTTSDAAGNYTLVVPLGGMPSDVWIAYAPPGYWETRLHPDTPLVANVMGPNMTRWQYGDGPVWSTGAMGSVYGSASITRDSAKGTISIAVRTCSDDIVEGVAIDIQPPPERIAYIDSVGFPSTTLTATVAPYASAMGFNAVPGPTRVTASKAGLTFLAVDLVVAAGDVVTYPVFHPLP